MATDYVKGYVATQLFVWCTYRNSIADEFCVEVQVQAHKGRIVQEAPHSTHSEGLLTVHEVYQQKSVSSVLSIVIGAKDITDTQSATLQHKQLTCPLAWGWFV